MRQAEPLQCEQQIQTLIHLNSTKEFMPKLCDLCNAAAEIYKDQRAYKHTKVMEDVVSYLNQHYCEQNMSLSSLAEKFEQPVSTLSRMFTDKLGIKFIDYLSDLRLKRASELLSETKMSIQEVANWVGYIDASSFTRKFSSKYGASPSAYRQRSNAEQETVEKED